MRDEYFIDPDQDEQWLAAMEPLRAFNQRAAVEHMNHCTRKFEQCPNCQTSRKILWPDDSANTR